MCNRKFLGISYYTKNASGYRYCIHEASFSSYLVHHTEPIGELVTKYPANKAIQIPKTFEVEAGIEEHISIHIMNKTEHELNGELKVEGLPVDNVDNALYKVYPKWVSYPHWPWRNYSYSNFKFTIPKDKKGEYTITVSDVSNNGIEPQTYKLIVK